MLKVKDFAIQEGVTTQAIYKLLKTHSEALEGHVLKAKKSTDLDEFAIAFLQEKMVGNNVVIADRTLKEELDRTKKELKTLQDELIIKNQMIITAQNDVLRLQSSQDEAIEKALREVEDEIKSKIEAEYEERMKRLTTELNNEKNKSWFDKLMGR